MKKHITNALIIFGLLLNCSISFAQNIEVKGLDNKANRNSLTLHLAATKLCREFYKQNDLIAARKRKSSYKGYDNISHYTCHVCTESIRSPFLNPLESFVQRYLKDSRIIKNQSNVFALRTLRKELNTTYLETYNQMVDSIDTENLVFYKYDLIQGYSFDTGKMTISLWNPSFKYLLPNTTSKNLIHVPILNEYGVDSRGKRIQSTSNILGRFQIPMTENKAQEIFTNYSNHHRPNPPFPIATKLYYALRLSDDFEGEPRYYQIVLKKAEFFLPSPENIKKTSRAKLILEMYHPKYKIAEVTFEDTIYHTIDGYPFQNIHSLK